MFSGTAVQDSCARVGKCISSSSVFVLRCVILTRTSIPHDEDENEKKAIFQNRIIAVG